MHVIHFNTFILSLLCVTAIVVAILIARTRPGEQVTRDRLELGSEDPGIEEPRSDE